MRFPGVMHVQADLLNIIHNVWSGECEVLKSTYKAAVSGRISHRGPIISSNLGTSVNRCCTWFAITHAMASKNVQGVLPLGQEEGVTAMLNSHTKEVM